jgi:hypothetical protein
MSQGSSVLGYGMQGLIVVVNISVPLGSPDICGAVLWWYQLSVLIDQEVA